MTTTLETMTTATVPAPAPRRGLVDYREAMKLGKRIPEGESGVMCPTGLGDGAYDVLVAKGTDGRPARILTVFLYPEQVEELRAVGR